MEKAKVTVIVEEHGGGEFIVKRVKNLTMPLGKNSVGEPKVVGVRLYKKDLDDLMAHGVEIIIDQPGYKRRWTP